MVTQLNITSVNRKKEITLLSSPKYPYPNETRETNLGANTDTNVGANDANANTNVDTNVDTKADTDVITRPDNDART